MHCLIGRLHRLWLLDERDAQRVRNGAYCGQRRVKLPANAGSEIRAQSGEERLESGTFCRGGVPTIDGESPL